MHCKSMAASKERNPAFSFMLLFQVFVVFIAMIMETFANGFLFGSFLFVSQTKMTTGCTVQSLIRRHGCYVYT